MQNKKVCFQGRITCTEILGVLNIDSRTLGHHADKHFFLSLADFLGKSQTLSCTPVVLQVELNTWEGSSQCHSLSYPVYSSATLGMVGYLEACIQACIRKECVGQFSRVLVVI